jgi:ribonucleoside-diphosphate reductase alpha chain
MSSQDINMYVIKRNGNIEKVNYDKILRRFTMLSNDHIHPLNIDFEGVTMKLIDQLYNKIHTSVIDELAAEQCDSLSTVHCDYGTLASLLLCSNHHKNTDSSFLRVVQKLYQNKNNDIHSPIVNKYLLHIAQKYDSQIQQFFDFKRDKDIDYFGFKTLERSYLLRLGDKVIERPQHMWMRVAVCIHGGNMSLVKNTYDYLSNKYFIHATPTLYNAGTCKQQLSSCFLLAMEDDSIDGIFSTLSDCAKISKWAGGIGLHIHNIRATGSLIRGTNGNSNGIVPMLKVFNNVARYVDQGGGKRPGSFAIYIGVEHADIEDFLDLRKNHGDEEARTRDLFCGLWVSDLFMTRVKKNLTWTLMCPDECPGLNDVYGKEYEELYCRYEKENKGRKQIRARDLWFKILESQIETGNPYLLFKDSANKKSNQQNLGVIKSSNLCTEIIEYSDKNETAVCNLASISLPKFVSKLDNTFDFEELGKVVETVTRNLNKIIDINFYPTDKTKRSNLLHRPIGIGVQGLADTFQLLKLNYDSEEAMLLNKNIFETIYYYAMKTSNKLAKLRLPAMKILYGTYHVTKEWQYQNDKPHCNIYTSDISSNIHTMLNNVVPVQDEIKKLYGDYLGAYSSFVGSPLHKGQFQFDLWDVKPSGKYDWDSLRVSVMNYGVRNSLLIAPMPTASTSQIMGNNECFEPYTSNIYTRRTKAGDFIVTNKHLLRELISINKWDEDIKNSIIKNNGSVQHLDIPIEIKNRYKTAWELKMKTLIDMSRDRGAFICQSQSLNLWMEDPTFNKLTSMHFYSWEQGLKTGIYYLRTKAKAKAQQFTIEPEMSNCEMCSG